MLITNMYRCCGLLGCIFKIWHSLDPWAEPKLNG